MRDVVAFPFVDFRKCEKEGYRTRDAHLIREFALSGEVGRVLVVNRPISVSEIFFKRRKWRMRAGHLLLSRRGLWLTQLDKNIFVLDILVADIFAPIIHRHAWWAHVMARKVIQNQIRRVMEYLELKDIQLQIYTPLAYPILGQLGESCSIFFAIDNWLVHPQLKSGREEIEIAYACLRKRADAIVTTSDVLSEYFRRDRGCVGTVLNGVNSAFFRRSSYHTPSDIESLPKPIVGYAGKIQERLDLELVRYLIEHLPDVSFVFIGQITSPKHFSKLGRYSNLYYLGDKKYDHLPNYLRAFDVCIVPHKGDGLAASMSPLKVYEYLASDRPVVTTELAGIEPIPGWLWIEGSEADFLAAIQTALTKKDRSPFNVPPEWNWSSRARQALSIINSCCGKQEQ